jgi:hypothetical protein
MPDPYNIPLTGAQISTALQATYLINKNASEVNDAINAAHNTSGSISSGGTNLVQSGTIHTALSDQGTATTAEIIAKIRSVTGWARYVDSQYTSGSPLSTGSVKTQLTINGSGTATETTYLPTGVTSLWNTSTNKITPAAVGDAYDVRLDFTATVTSGNEVAEVIFEVNGSPLAHRTVTFAKTGSTSFSIGLPMSADSAFLTNGCSIQFDTSDAIDIYDISLFIKRDFTALT